MPASGFIGGPRVRGYVAIACFVLMAVLIVVFAVGYLRMGDSRALVALMGGWSVIVAAVAYITHPGPGDNPPSP